ncbi:MAG: hypothetical protein RMI90_04180 [Thermoguttaceae bacterium]|nr:hypothetical protein [Thermoguttaceae bacterium]
MSGTEPSAPVLAAEAQSAMEFGPEWSGACIWGVESAVWLAAGAASVGLRRTPSMRRGRLPVSRIYRHRRRVEEDRLGGNPSRLTDVEHLSLRPRLVDSLEGDSPALCFG